MGSRARRLRHARARAAPTFRARARLRLSADFSEERSLDGRGSLGGRVSIGGRESFSGRDSLGGRVSLSGCEGFGGRDSLGQRDILADNFAPRAALPPLFQPCAAAAEAPPRASPPASPAVAAFGEQKENVGSPVAYSFGVAQRNGSGRTRVARAPTAAPSPGRVAAEALAAAPARPAPPPSVGAPARPAPSPLVSPPLEAAARAREPENAAPREDAGREPSDPVSCACKRTRCLKKYCGA